MLLTSQDIVAADRIISKPLLVLVQIYIIYIPKMNEMPIQISNNSTNFEIEKIHFFHIP